ncbi:hypothetical protein BC940DRAFT_288147 [Gongronella butleri]|nr:hypothetical protein BC940DRAFT_288147 [Gongronella butleri]
MSGKSDTDTEHVETYDFLSLQSELGLVDGAQQDEQEDVAFADHLQANNRLAFADFEAPEANLSFEELAFHRRTAPAATAPHMHNPLLDKDPLANKKSGKPNHPYAPRKLPTMAVDTRPVTSGLSFAAVASSTMKSGQKSPDPETIPVPIDLHEQDKHQADMDDGTRAAPPQAPNMAGDALHQRPNMLLNVLLGVPPGATPPPPPPPQPAPVAMLPQQQQHHVPGRFVKLNVNDLFASAGSPPGPAGHMQKPNLTASQEIKQLLEDGGSKNDAPQPKSMKPDSQE